MLGPVGRSIGVAPALALVALAGAGCGTTSQADQAKSVVKTFLTAAAKGDGAKACDQLSADARRLLESATSASCDKVVQELGSRTSTAQRSSVDKIEPSVSIHGTTATATYRGVTGSRQLRTLTLEKVAGRWKISQLPSSG